MIGDRDKDETEHDQDANLVRAELVDLPQDSVNIQRHIESELKYNQEAQTIALGFEFQYLPLKVIFTIITTIFTYLGSSASI